MMPSIIIRMSSIAFFTAIIKGLRLNVRMMMDAGL